MSFIKKENNLFRILRQASGTLAILVGLTMIFAFIQLKYLKPLENPALVFLKEQYDNNPDNEEIREQIRALDLMARKAYFSARWQVKTGSYILLASVLVFVVCQRLISGSQKKIPAYPADGQDLEKVKKYTRKYLIYSASGIIIFAIILSFIMLKDLPDPSFVKVDDVPEKTKSYTGISASTGKEVLEDIDHEEEVQQDKTLSQIADVSSQEEAGNIPGIADTVEEKKEEILSYDPLDNYPFFRGKGSRGVV